MKSSIIAFFIFLFPVIVHAQKDQESITVLTYNIYHGENPITKGTPNLPEIAALINELKPDVVALQEVDSMTTRSASIYDEKVDLVQRLSELTGYQGYFAKAMDYAEGGYGEGLLVKNQGDFETQQLSTPVGGEPRAAAWAEITLDSGKKIVFAGTHLCHQFEENRIAQVSELTKKANSQNRPTIWAGDLNLRPDSKAYQSVKGNWKDSGALPSTYSNTYGTEDDGARIDYVWFDAKKFSLLKYEVLKVTHSDHYPVLVTLQLK